MTMLQIHAEIYRSLAAIANDEARLRQAARTLKRLADKTEENLSGFAAFRKIRKQAECGKFPDLTLDEINDEISLARKERRS